MLKTGDSNITVFWTANVQIMINYRPSSLVTDTTSYTLHATDMRRYQCITGLLICSAHMTTVWSFHMTTVAHHRRTHTHTHTSRRNI